MRELRRIRDALFEAGFHEFQRNKFRRLVGSDGLEHGAELDLFRRYGRRHAKIIVGVWHPQIAISLASLFSDLNEQERVRVIRAGFAWLLSHEIETTNIEDIDMETRQGPPAGSPSPADMLRQIHAMRSLANVVQVVTYDAVQWRGWARQNSLLGLKILIAIELLLRRGDSIDHETRSRAMNWVVRDPRYATIAPEQLRGLVVRAVSRSVS